MNQPRPDHDDDIIPLKLNSGGSDPAAPMDLGSLSPEARLATALVMQAQALDGMRRSQDDLLRRLSEASRGDDAPLRDSVGRVHARLDDMHESQGETADELVRLRRRSLVGRVIMSVVLLLGLGGATWWITAALPPERDETAVLAALADVREQSRAALTEAVSRIDASTSRDQDEQGRLAASLAGLGERIAEQEQATNRALEVLTAERDEAVAAAAALRDELAARDVSVGDWKAQANKAQSEALGMVTENKRLRTQLLEQERQRNDLLASLESLRLAATLVQPSAMQTSLDSGEISLAEQLNLALQSGGPPRAKLVEVGAVQDGQLTDVMLLELDAFGEPAGLVRAERARLGLGPEGLHLLLEDPGALEPTVALVPLGETDLEAWKALGVVLPDAQHSLAGLRVAVSTLLAAQGLTVLELGGADQVALTDLLVRQGDRRLRAGRVEFDPSGPALVFKDGVVIAAGEERPFFQGQLRMTLPGLSAAAWHGALSPGAP